MKIAIFVLGLCLAVLAIVPSYGQEQTTELVLVTDATTELRNVTIEPKPAYAFLLHAIKTILFGRPKNESIFDKLENVKTDLKLSEMLDFATRYFIGFLNQNDYLPEDYETNLQAWNEILFILEYQGSGQVTLEMLKPFILLLRPDNLAKFWKRIDKKATFNSTSKQISENFKDFIFNDFLENVKNPACKNFVALWFQDIAKGKQWALRMFDSAGKPPVGLFNGNINWVGSYKECKETVGPTLPNAKAPLFTGRYCRATMNISSLLDYVPPEINLPNIGNLGIESGVCVPNVCDDADVAEIVNKTLELLVLRDKIPVQSVKCEAKEPYSTAFYAYTGISLFLIAFVVLATVFDCIHRAVIHVPSPSPLNVQDIIGLKRTITGLNVLEPKHQYQATIKQVPKPGALTEFILNCSMYKNSERIFSTNSSGKFTCLNGLRALSMIWIIMAHTFNYIGDFTYFFTVTNIKELKDLEESPAAQLIINGMYGVDTFFLMSAFLLTYSFMRKLQKNQLTTFEWVYYYAHRYWRLVPPYAIIIALYIYVIPWLGYGPLWYQKEFPIKNEDCHSYWWSYLLMLNNFIPNGKGTSCMGFLWYVCNDYQLYAISPVFLLLLYYYPIAGTIVLVGTLLSSLNVMAYLMANVYQAKNRDIIATLFDMWGDVYIKPYCRAGPWIIGIFLGYLFFKVQKVKLTKVMVTAGWLISTCLALATIFGGYTNHGKGWRRMGVAEYAAYFSLTRVAWPLSIGWIIFACHYGYGGLVNRILSAKVFLPLTKLSYSAYLIHPVIMVIYTYAQQGLTHATELTLVYLFFGHMVLVFIITFFYTQFFELPFIALEKLAMRSIRPQKHED